MIPIAEDACPGMRSIPEKRVITYLKLGEKESIRVYLNCEEKDVELKTCDHKKVIYSKKWTEKKEGCGTLGKDGILILAV